MSQLTQQEKENNVKAAIKNILFANDAYNELKESNWIKPVETVMNNPDVVERVLRAYDLKWIIESEEDYDRMLKNWNNMLNKFPSYTDEEKGKVYTAAELEEAIFEHMMRLQRARPKYRRIMPLKQYELKTESYSFDADDNVGMVAEEEVAYSGLKPVSRNEDWVSVRNTYEVPDDGECVLVAGYYLPGLIVYKTAIYIRDENVYDVDITDDKPFTLLYWKRIGPAPKDFMNQI